VVITIKIPHQEGIIKILEMTKDKVMSKITETDNLIIIELMSKVRRKPRVQKTKGNKKDESNPVQTRANPL